MGLGPPDRTMQIELALLSWGDTSVPSRRSPRKRWALGVEIGGRTSPPTGTTGTLLACAAVGRLLALRLVQRAPGHPYTRSRNIVGATPGAERSGSKASVRIRVRPSRSPRPVSPPTPAHSVFDPEGPSSAHPQTPALDHADRSAPRAHHPGPDTPFRANERAHEQTHARTHERSNLSQHVRRPRAPPSAPQGIRRARVAPVCHVHRRGAAPVRRVRDRRARRVGGTHREQGAPRQRREGAGGGGEEAAHGRRGGERGEEAEGRRGARRGGGGG